MSEKTCLPSTEETKADNACRIGSSKQTENKTDNLKECKIANSVRRHNAKSKNHQKISWKHKRQIYDKSGSVLKISLSLFSKRKAEKLASQKSKSFYPSSPELPTHSLHNAKKSAADYDVELPKSISPKKKKRIYKPRPKKLCDICLKVFADSSSFAKHKRIHLKEKPYKCDQCHKLFRQSHDLKRHIKTHTNDKDFSCDQCSSKFTCPSNLKRHKVVHAQKKPFQCRHCENSFTQLNELKTHTRLHTQNDLFKCQLCNMNFSRASSVKRHMSRNICKKSSS